MLKYYRACYHSTSFSLGSFSSLLSVIKWNSNQKNPKRTASKGLINHKKIRRIKIAMRAVIIISNNFEFKFQMIDIPNEGGYNVFFRLVILRQFPYRKVGAREYNKPPHEGRLFYEQRFGITFQEFHSSTKNFVDNHISIA